MSDLLPELQFHTHDRGKLSVALLVGLAIAWGIGILEQRSHADHDHALPGAEAHDSGEHDHDHHHGSDHDHAH